MGEQPRENHRANVPPGGRLVMRSLEAVYQGGHPDLTPGWPIRLLGMFGHLRALPVCCRRTRAPGGHAWVMGAAQPRTLHASAIPTQAQPQTLAHSGILWHDRAST